jgi:undecaprenyl diphosphate synthase
VRTIVRTCRQIGIRNLTLYAFSTENWQRPKSETQALMTLLVKFLDSELKEMMDNNIRLDTIGEIDRLPQKVQKALLRTMDLTRENDGMRLILALSYGSRAEIVRMAQALAQKASSGAIEPDAINTELVSQHLYTFNIPDPDLLIRTSGEMRISNFLLWQIAYTEIYVTDTLWPDFGKEEFLHILKEFQQRERRYGKVGE